MLRAFSLKKKKKGQTTCYQCSKIYNNNVVPKLCSCGYLLNGTYEPKIKEDSIDAFRVGDLVSVRQNRQGLNIRTFVDLEENKVLRNFHTITLLNTYF